VSPARNLLDTVSEYKYITTEIPPPGELRDRGSMVTIAPGFVRSGYAPRLMSSQSFSHVVSIGAEPRQVFDALQEAETWRSIGGVARVSDAAHDADGLLTGYRFVAEVGGQDRPGEARVVESIPPEAMTVAITSRELTASIAVTISSAAPGAIMAVVLTARPNGLIATLAFPVIAAAIGSGLPRNVESFATRLS